MGRNATAGGQVCAVCGVKSRDNKKLTFHGPSKHEPTKKKWAEALKHVGKVTEDTLVCSKHFRDADFMMKNVPGAKSGEVNKVLKKIAVPVLHLKPDKPAETTGKMPIKITIKKEKNKDTPKVTIKTEKHEKDVQKVKVKKEKEEPPKPPKKDKKDAKEAKMSKKQQETVVVQPRHQSRRAASKEALKQMQILLDDEDDDTPVEVPDDDDEVIPIPVVVSPPKKKYKLTHRKSADGNDREVLVLKSITPSITNHYVENNLELECWTEELEPCQKERITKLEEAEKEMQAAIDQLIKSTNAEIVYKKDLLTAVEVQEQVKSTISTVQAAANQAATQPSIVLNSALTNISNPSSYQLVMDSRTGLIVGALPAAQQQGAPQKQLGNIQVASNLQQPPPVVPPAPTGPRPRGRGRPKATAAAAAMAPGVPPSPRVLNQTAKRMPVLPPITPPVTRGRGAAVAHATTSEKPTPPSKRFSQQQQPPQQATPAAPPPPAAAASPVVGPSSATTTIGPSANARPSEANVEGGLAAGGAAAGARPKAAVVDLTGDDGRPLPDSREISFNKLQGKTFPSLVVVARPHLRVSDANADRTKLDAKVKSVLMLAPTKFTEWLIQQGLVRSEQRCSVHGNAQLKLGMYSDVSKFPFSGGYVWISECCSQRFVSVFSGSLFEGSPHQPLVILKLLYHWACQTNIQNVTQWVKVDNLYVKGMYTWLRSVCTSAIHTHFRQIGGVNKKVEVGVISLGTTSQDGNSRQVKVEVLGVLESDTKLIRLRAVEPLGDNDRNYKKRFTKILDPLSQWVHPLSTIVTDLTVDKVTLHHMGFTNVIQATTSESGLSNRTVMEYLRRIVPRMFQNTLSLLSRQIIQQFLDELVWREWFGTTSCLAFDNLVAHLAEQTRLDSGTKLIARLNRIALNPFKNWAVSSPTANSVVKPIDNSIVPKKRKRKEMEGAGKPPQNTNVEARPPKSNSPDVPEQMVPLENYYYGTIDNYPQKANIVLNMKCPFCKEHSNNNIMLMNHLFHHAHNVAKDGQMCRYCLTSVPTNNDLLKHIATSHPSETKFDNGFVCLICETHYINPFVLGRHMSREHQPSELPYQCGTCGYRCSNHKQAIDHFYRQHDNGPTIQCPFCLKSTTVFSSSRNIVQNMNYFIQHLQKHQRKQFARRCGKCNLWFVQKDALKEHQTRAHASQRGKRGLVPWTAPRNGVMVPKSKLDRYPGDADVINFTLLHYSVPKHLLCRECNTPMDSPKHFPSFESCQNPNCQYSTCCSNAMQEHNAKCNKNTTAPTFKEPLPYEMFCVCGYSNTDGNQMARHLAICERKSAYPSKTEAAAASVTHSMLDVLGLVRKPDETEKKTASETKPEPVVVEDTEFNEIAEEKHEPVEIVEEEIDRGLDVATEASKETPMETDTEREKIGGEKSDNEKVKSTEVTVIDDEVESIEMVDKGVSEDSAKQIEKQKGDGSVTEKEDSATEKEDSATEKEESVTEKEDSATDKEDRGAEKEDDTIEKDDNTVEKDDNTIEKDDSMIEKDDSTTEKDDSTIEKDVDMATEDAESEDPKKLEEKLEEGRDEENSDEKADYSKSPRETSSEEIQDEILATEEKQVEMVGNKENRKENEETQKESGENKKESDENKKETEESLKEPEESPKEDEENQNESEQNPIKPPFNEDSRSSLDPSEETAAPIEEATKENEDTFEDSNKEPSVPIVEDGDIGIKEDEESVPKGVAESVGAEENLRNDCVNTETDFADESRSSLTQSLEEKISAGEVPPEPTPMETD